MRPSIRLLTFNQLPNRQLVGDLSPFTQVYEQLDSTTTFFENFYLQAQGITGVLANSETVSKIGIALQKKCLSATYVNVNPDPDDKAINTLPEWLQCHRVDSPDVLHASLKDRAFVWLNCRLGLHPETAEQDAATIEHCLKQLRELDQQADYASDSLLLVTSLNGVAPPDGLTFESQLFDSRIRVPMWVETRNKDSARTQALAGNFDILETISQLIAGNRDEPESSAGGECAPQNLLHITQETRQGPERSIHLQFDDISAIRMASFLFVKNSRGHQGSGADISEYALYSKPADIWNIHDVSAEYHELMNKFCQQHSEHQLMHSPND